LGSPIHEVVRRARGIGRTVHDHARDAYEQLLLPGLESFLRDALPPRAADVEPTRPGRPAPPAPSGWTPTIQVGSTPPAPSIARRVLPVLHASVERLTDMVRCAAKGTAIISAASCLAFQAEAVVRLRRRQAETRERAPSAFEGARPVCTLHECLECADGHTLGKKRALTTALRDRAGQ